MAQNKLTDLNNHLFAQLERLGEEDLPAEQIELECKRAKAITGLATQVVNNARLTLEAAKLVHGSEIDENLLPETIINKSKQINP